MPRIKRRDATIWTPATDAQSTEWNDFAKTALRASIFFGVVAGGVHLLSWLSRREHERIRAASRLDDSLTDAANETNIDPAVIEAAALLGISPTASRAEVRAALRTRLQADGIHPDHGGDAEQTRRLIAARDLLLAHLDQTEQAT